MSRKKKIVLVWKFWLPGFSITPMVCASVSPIERLMAKPGASLPLKYTRFIVEFSIVPFPFDLAGLTSPLARLILTFSFGISG